MRLLKLKSCLYLTEYVSISQVAINLTMGLKAGVVAPTVPDPGWMPQCPRPLETSKHVQAMFATSSELVTCKQIDPKQRIPFFLFSPITVVAKDIANRYAQRKVIAKRFLRYRKQYLQNRGLENDLRVKRKKGCFTVPQQVVPKMRRTTDC